MGGELQGYIGETQGTHFKGRILYKRNPRDTFCIVGTSGTISRDTYSQGEPWEHISRDTYRGDPWDIFPGTHLIYREPHEHILYRVEPRGHILRDKYRGDPGDHNFRDTYYLQGTLGTPF